MGAFIPRLSEDYRTIVLGGAKLGIAALLEARGGAAGCLGMVRNLMVEAELQAVGTKPEHYSGLVRK
jgi:hypothetical protein